MTDAASAAPSPLRSGIKVRRMDHRFTPDVPDDWADNPLLTALLAGLSASFPPGERYFIESVRHYVDRLDDPGLEERVRGFIGQEANHTKEHLAFNAFLDARGLPVGKIQKVVEQALKRVKQRSSPAENLARTVALEHMTAFLASALLDDPEVLARMHPTVAAFWAWHAIEEIEHRSVAFDVYKRFVDDERLRLLTMAEVTFFFSVLTAMRTAVVLEATGNLFNLPAIARGLDVLFGRPGVLRKAMPLYRAYYRRAFHPDDHDNHEATARAKSQYLGAAA